MLPRCSSRGVKPARRQALMKVVEWSIHALDGEAELGAQHRDQGPDVLPAEAVAVDAHDVAVVRSAGRR